MIIKNLAGEEKKLNMRYMMDRYLKTLHERGIEITHQGIWRIVLSDCHINIYEDSYDVFHKTGHFCNYFNTQGDMIMDLSAYVDEKTNRKTDDLVSSVEYAKMQGISDATVRQGCARGQYPSARKIGRNWFLSAGEVRKRGKK